MKFVEPVRPNDFIAGYVPRPDAEFPGVQRRAQTLFAFAQRLLCALALGNVASDFRSADKAPTRVFYRRHGERNVNPAALLSDPNGLVRIGPLAALDAIQD